MTSARSLRERGLLVDGVTDPQPVGGARRGRRRGLGDAPFDPTVTAAELDTCRRPADDVDEILTATERSGARQLRRRRGRSRRITVTTSSASRSRPRRHVPRAAGTGPGRCGDGGSARPRHAGPPRSSTPPTWPTAWPPRPSRVFPPPMSCTTATCRRTGGPRTGASSAGDRSPSPGCSRFDAVVYLTHAQRDDVELLIGSTGQRPRRAECIRAGGQRPQAQPSPPGRGIVMAMLVGRKRIQHAVRAVAAAATLAPSSS